ncbi:unnamed protein product [Trichobilharzia szidati]|nr:unnamed protein product [Trichobilharzia szidati]
MIFKTYKETGDSSISNNNNHTCTNPMKKGCLIKRNECKQNETQERNGEYEENSLIIKSLNQPHDFEYNQYHEGYHHRDHLNNSRKEDIRIEQQCNTEENLYTTTTTTATATTGWINNHGDGDRVQLHEENDVIRQKNTPNSMKSLIIENVIYPDEEKSYRRTNFLSKSNGLESSLLYDHLLPITNDEIKSSETGHQHNNYELPSLFYTNLSNDITGLNISSLYNYAEQIWSPSLFSSITSSSLPSTTGLGIGTNHPPTFHAFNQHSTPNLSCTGCHESIHDKLFLSMDNKYWHLNCLRCFKCGITLQWEKTCFVKNDSVFCREHYKKLSSCFRCGEKLQKNDLIFQVDADTLYHESCFNCYTCGRLLKCGDTYIMDGKTIQCSLHDSVTANKQSYIMTKILASSLSDLFTAANYAYSYSSNSQSQITPSTNTKLSEIFTSKGLDELNTGSGNVNLERTTEMKTNLFSGMMKPSDEYEHQKCVPMSFDEDAIDFNSTCITEAPQGNYPIVQLCDTYDKHMMKTTLGQIPSEVNESPAEFPLIADKILPCDEKELNDTKNSQFYFINANINYLTDNLISNPQTPSAFTEVIGKTIRDDNNNNSNKSNFNVETMLNFLPRIDTVNNSFGVKSNVTTDNMTITGSSSGSSSSSKNCLLNISSTWTSNGTTLTSPVHSFCSSSSSSPPLSSTCLVSSSSPPSGISGGYSKLILTSKNNTPTTVDNGSSFNSRVSKQVEQNHILNKIEMPISTHFFENHDSKYNGKFNSIDKQQSFNDNMKSQVLIDISVKHSSLLKNGKLEQFKSGKAQKSTKKLDNERLLSTDKLHGRLEKNTGKMKRIRTSFKHQQLRIMKSYFEFSHNPDSKDLKQLSQKTGLSKRVLQVWFQNARAKFRRNTNSQVYVENSKSNDSIPVAQYTTSTATTTTTPPPLNMNVTNASTCQNITDSKFYTGLGGYNYEEEKADSIYPKSVTSDYDIFLPTSSNQNNTRFANNFSSHDDNKHDIICLTSDLPTYGDQLSQPVR